MAQRGGYREAVQWIADNDESLEDDVSALEGLISVALVADLFRKPAETVARDVLRRRERGD